MLWVLALLGIGFSVIMVFCTIGDFIKGEDRDFILGDLIIIIIAGAIGGGAICGINEIQSLYYEEVVQTNDWQIVPIEDSSQISGKINYIRVSLDTNEVYSFYYQTNDGGVRRENVFTEQAVIYEDNNCTPHVIEYTTYMCNEMDTTLLNILAPPMYEQREEKKELEENRSYEIYIPEGSILRTFALDSQ